MSTASAFSPSLSFAPQRQRLLIGWEQVGRSDDPAVVLNAGGSGGGGGMPEVQEAPLLFDDDLLNDMQLALLAMEKRIQEGPHSLSKVQVDELEERLNRIMKEMRENEHKRPTKPARRTDEDIDTSMDEGPLYDGRGGMGQPRGTVNTYIIEGMDEMTTDEYRLALQQSIIDKQNERRKSGAALGGRGTSDYINSLGSQGGMFRKDD